MICTLSTEISSELGVQTEPRHFAVSDGSRQVGGPRGYKNSYHLVVNNGCFFAGNREIRGLVATLLHRHRDFFPATGQDSQAMVDPAVSPHQRRSAPPQTGGCQSSPKGSLGGLRCTPTCAT